MRHNADAAGGPRAVVSMVLSAIVTTQLRVVAAVLAAVTIGIGLLSTSTAQAAVSRLVPADRPGVEVNPGIGEIQEAAEKLQARQAMLQTQAQARRAKLVKAIKQERTLRTRVVKIARAQIGDSYVRGGSGPSRFDCSGLTSYVIKQATGRKLPHQSRAQYHAVKRISAKSAKPGDLVFFFKRGARHVGIYIGGGRMIDATNPAKDVRVSPIYGSWGKSRVSGFGRVIPSATTAAA